MNVHLSCEIHNNLAIQFFPGRQIDVLSVVISLSVNSTDRESETGSCSCSRVVVGVKMRNAAPFSNLQQ